MSVPILGKDAVKLDQTPILTPMNSPTVLVPGENRSLVLNLVMVWFIKVANVHWRSMPTQERKILRQN